MRAVTVLTRTGPILILTSYPDIHDPDFVGKLKAKGLKKFMAFEVPVNQCQDI